MKKNYKYSELTEKERAPYSELGDNRINNYVSSFLYKRGVDAADAAKFLSPDYSTLSDPHDLVDMEKSVERIWDAILNDEKIWVYADYDADGIPGATVLFDFFSAIGYGEKVETYIPHRHQEGYGFHAHTIPQMLESDVSLVITVDVGISEHDSVKLAQERGIDVIVTDHHEISETLPEAFAVINPKRPGYADPMLCGAAVAWQLVRALSQFMKNQDEDDIPENITVPYEGQEKWLLDLVGMATLSDMVPLQKENRTLAWFGMHVLKKTKRTSLQCLAKAAGSNLMYMTPKDVVFGMTPLINAASRMDHPMRAYEMLAATDEVSATAAIKHLQSCNRKRKTSVASIMKKAHARIKDLGEIPDVMVIGHRDWNVGIVGLVASKIVDTYGIPAFVWGGYDETTLKGSCRAPGEGPKEINLHTLMHECADDFVHFGGHAGAGGFAVTTINIHHLQEHLIEAARRLWSEASTTGIAAAPVAELDFLIKPNEINVPLFKKLAVLEPHGVGNPAPLVGIRGKVVEVKQFGKEGDHFEIRIADESGYQAKAIAFYKKSEHFPELTGPDQEIYLIGHLEESRFAGRIDRRMSLVDIVVEVNIS